jgi:hypothetical protein
VAPTLTNSYYVESNKDPGDTNTLVTSSFTPADGEVLVIKATTWDTAVTSGTPSGGGLTYTSQVTQAPGGTRSYVRIFTAVVGTSPGSMTVTLSAPSAQSYHSMCVERWSGAQLAATPVTNAANAGAQSAPSSTITTAAANSIVTWVCADNLARSPATRAYLSSATEDGLGDGSSQVSNVFYHAYQTAAAAGSQTYGLSTPSNMLWVLAAIEVQASAGVAASGPAPLPRYGPGRIAPGGQWTPRWPTGPATVAPNSIPSAENAAGTGQALDATLNISPAAGNAAGTGLANAATLNIAPSAGNAAGTGLANAAAPNVAPAAGNAAGSGTAQTPTLTNASNAAAGNASGTGLAQTPTINVAPAAGNAAGTGLANNAAPSVAASAAAATGTGTAQAPVPNVSAAAAAATGTGLAQSPAPAISVFAGNAAGTGTAYDTTVSTTGSQNANAGNAAGTGTAYDTSVTTVSASPRPTVLVYTGRRATAWDAPPPQFTISTPTSGVIDASPAAGLATGTGAAYQPTVNTSGNTSATAGVATGTGAANAATLNVAPAAGNAAGTGTAQPPTPNVATNAGVASGTGAALQPNVSTTGATNVNAGNAAGTGTANQPAVTVAPTVGRAQGTGAALAAVTTVGTGPGTAAGTGAARQPAVTAPNATAGTATGTGTAYNASITSTTSVAAGVATGTGAANAATIQLVAIISAGTATGTGAAYNTLNGVPVVLYPISAGLIADQAVREHAGTITDNASRDHAGVIADGATRYRSGAPT